MAYSLKNIGDRVAALEKAGSSSWSKGSNTNGYWVKESKTGLIIQWGRNGNMNQWEAGGTRNFPIPFTNVNSISMAAVQWSTTNGQTGSWSERIRALSATSFYWWANCSPMHWIAIGYLITNRLLNIYYIAIFVHIFLIFSRFLQS